MNSMYYHRRASGFSLIELMVAMVIGLILIAGVMQIFLGNRQAQRIEQSVSRIEENGRIAMDLISQDMRAAGFYGCSRTLTGEITASGQTIFSIKAAPATFTVPVSNDFLTNSVRGFQRDSGGVWSPVLTTDLNSGSITSARKSSDLVAIYYGQPTAAKLTGNIFATMDVVATSNGTSISQNSQVLVGNCAATDLITVTNSPAAGTTITLQHAASGNTSSSLTATAAQPYGTDSKISQFIEHVYFVKDSGRKSPLGQTIYSLYRRDNGAAPQELVEGIEFLHILYGEQLTGGNIRYVPANAAGINWSNVVSVQIAMLAQSFDSVRDNDDVNTYTLLDQSIGATGTTITHSGGRSLRRVYNATIELRNRMQ